jgi:hypothetical protein
MRIKKLVEEIAAKYKSPAGGEFPIFKLTDRSFRSDVNEILKSQLTLASSENREFRWIADPATKNVYAFTVHMIHANASKKLGLHLDEVISGFAEVTNSGKCYTFSSEVKGRPWINKFIKFHVDVEPVTEDIISIYRNSYGYEVPIFRLTEKSYLHDLSEVIKVSMRREFRFVADERTKDVYVFPTSIIHAQAIKSLGLSPHAVIEGYGNSSTAGIYSFSPQIEDKPWINKFIKFKEFNTDDAKKVIKRPKGKER